MHKKLRSIILDIIASGMEFALHKKVKTL